MGYSNAPDIKEMMDILRTALTAELEKLDPEGENPLCANALYPGDSVPIDYAECGGMAWVRLVTTVPSVAGSGYDITAASCYWGLAHQLELGVMRKAPIPETILSTMELPDDAENTNATYAQLDDMKAMHRTILYARSRFDLLPADYTPVGPVGGAVGGTWALTVSEE